MTDFMQFFMGLLGRIIWIISPLIVEIFDRVFIGENTSHLSILSNDSIRGMATNYSDSLTILLCLLVVCVGSILGVFYPTPKYGDRPMPKWLKGILSVTAGVMAFAYYIDTKKNISPAICIWVAGVSFVAPAIVHLVHAGAIKFVGKKLKITGMDLKRIRKSFWDSE